MALSIPQSLPPQQSFQQEAEIHRADETEFFIPQKGKQQKLQGPKSQDFNRGNERAIIPPPPVQLPDAPVLPTLQHFQSRVAEDNEKSDKEKGVKKSNPAKVELPAKIDLHPIPGHEQELSDDDMSARRAHFEHELRTALKARAITRARFKILLSQLVTAFEPETYTPGFKERVSQIAQQKGVSDLSPKGRYRAIRQIIAGTPSVESHPQGSPQKTAGGIHRLINLVLEERRESTSKQRARARKRKQSPIQENPLIKTPSVEKTDSLEEEWEDESLAMDYRETTVLDLRYADWHVKKEKDRAVLRIREEFQGYLDEYTSPQTEPALQMAASQEL